MKGLVKNWKVVGIVASVIFFIGVSCVCYFRSNSDKYGSVESFDAGNVIKDDVQNAGAQEKSVEKSKKADDVIYIHIVGEVRNQGVVTLNKGQRIMDAIEKAGGVTEEADLSKVNLAFVLSDGQKVRIPSVNDEAGSGEEFVTAGGGYNVVQGGSGGSVGVKVNINNASQTELETISGVGPSLAAKIINYREKNGKFRSIEELKNISGIGDAKFEGMKDFVEV